MLTFTVQEQDQTSKEKNLNNQGRLIEETALTLCLNNLSFDGTKAHTFDNIFRKENIDQDKR